MKHKVRLTVIDKKLYPELQHQYCADPDSGACPCYNVGDVFEFYRDEENDHFWHGGLNTLVKTDVDLGHGCGRPEDAALLRSMGRHFPLYLYRSAGRFHHEELDEGRKHDDLLLF